MTFQKTLSVILSLSFFSYSAFSQDGQDGKTLFSSNCASCHSIGKGRLVGSDLKGITEKRNEDWLLKWIKSSQSLIKSGDADAVAVYEANKVPMPDFAFLSDEQIKAILAYIKDESIASDKVASSPISVSEQANQAVGKKIWFSFSTTEYILLAIVGILLIVTIVLSRIIKKLSEQLMDFYSGNY